MVDAKYAMDIVQVLTGVASLPKAVVTTGKIGSAATGYIINGTKVIVKNGNVSIAKTTEQLNFFKNINIYDWYTTVDRPTTGIQWGKGIQGQGMPWEDYLATQLPVGSRLPQNFKTFDYFDDATGAAISAKTLDTTSLAKTNNPKQIYQTIKTNIDAASNFNGYTLSGRTISSSMIKSKEVKLAIPENTDLVQWAQINKAIQYGQTKGVKLTITVVK